MYYPDRHTHMLERLYVTAERWPTWSPPCCWWLCQLGSTLPTSPEQLSPFAEKCCHGNWSPGTPRCQRCPHRCWRGWPHWRRRTEARGLHVCVRFVKGAGWGLDLGFRVECRLVDWIYRGVCIIFWIRPRIKVAGGRVKSNILGNL